MHKWGRVRYGQSRKFKPMATPKNAGPEINAEVSEYFAGLAKVRAHSGEPPEVTHIVKQVLASGRLPRKRSAPDGSDISRQRESDGFRPRNVE